MLIFGASVLNLAQVASPQWKKDAHNLPIPPEQTQYFFPALLRNIYFIFGHYQPLLIAVIQLFPVYSLESLAQCASMSSAQSLTKVTLKVDNNNTVYSL